MQINGGPRKEEEVVKIKDVYAGKPDAKDEVETEGLNSFLENYVMPSNFNIDALVNGSGYYITGYKGTGKTALLYYLEDYIRKSDEQMVSSFIFFKGDYSDLRKQEMVELAKRLTSAISIGNNVVLDATDFEIIWRWLFYCRIIEDNRIYKYGIYLKDKYWNAFENKVSQIGCERKKHFLSIPPKIQLTCPIIGMNQVTSISPTLDLDFQKGQIEESKSYNCFAEIINEADELFAKLKRTDIPYYIFIDELEAYYGERKVFERDLRLIRDLIISVKKINQTMSREKHVKTKVICSVRTEIINSINRFIISKEINKITSGFEVPLIWNYTNTNSFMHPIMRILVKRIEYGERKCGEYRSEKKLVEKWFPEKINGADPASYILNNSWCKPRDIVRLILAAQNNIGCDNESFSQKTIDLSRKRYSQESLIEIQEEMKALYSPNEIDLIIRCLTGYKRIFSVDELRDRIHKYYKGTLLENRLTDILADLYRLGMIGNCMKTSQSYRWQHKGDDQIIISDEWQLMIHPALQNALSVNKMQDKIIEKEGKSKIKSGIIVEFRITKLLEKYALGGFWINGNDYAAVLNIERISSVAKKDIRVGKKYKAKIMEYDEIHKKWKLLLEEGTKL